ncbi:MAG: hypothetical protein VYE15_05260 [Myxococcota bacterium]|nr:hypothetical protein [Myxococcota bacterium]
MTESSTPPKSFKIVHGIALVFLFLMMAQPTFDNIRAMLTGSMVMGDISIEVTFSKMILHVVAMAIGWVGLWWFFKRQKRGAYMSIAAHLLGLTATVTQTPELMEMFPPAMIGVFFVLLFAVTLGPILGFKDQYS